ncbi:MAG: hypothetical protein R2864_09455 [Syntrophotaleaceae bacterium]
MIGERSKAIEILEKGIKKGVADDTVGQPSAPGRQEDEDDGYGDLWYQFHLEKQGAVMKQQTRAVQGGERS